MKIQNPHIITEGEVEYPLGKLEENQILYDFEKILFYLDAKGKLLFGEDFKIYDKERELLYKLSNYFIKNKEKCNALNIDLNKGILLTGPVNCGKTSLMKLVRYIVPHQRFYEIISTRNITFAFNNLGYRVIEKYGNQNFYCFDDLGIEPTGRYYGEDCNVIGEIILSRFELFLEYKLKTHAITNLNAIELEERYGKRVRTRMRQMFNLISFDSKSIDKRFY